MIGKKYTPPHIKHGRRDKRANAEERRSIPFHTGKVLQRRISLDAVDALAAKGDRLAEWRERRKWLEDPTLYRTMTEHELTNAPESQYTDADIRDLLEADEIEYTPARDVKAWMHTFTVVEEKVGGPVRAGVPQRDDIGTVSIRLRRRGIGWPKYNNDAINYVPHIELTKVTDQLRQVEGGQWATCADLAKSFSQLPLSPAVAAFHAFRDAHGHWYRFKVAVMGSRPSAEIMEEVTNILARTGAPTGAVITTHIDNVRFLGSRATVAAAMTNFIDNCDFVGATVHQEEDSMPHRQGVSFGVHYDYEQGWAALPLKQLRKLHTWYQELSSRPMPLKRVFELYGSLFYASCILGMNLSTRYFEIKWYRRKAAQFEKHQNLWEEVQMPTSVVRGVSKWLETLLQNSPQAHAILPSEITLFSDASKDGFGAVLFQTGSGGYEEFGKKEATEVFAGTWTDEERNLRIHILEARALAAALQHFKPLLRNKVVQAYVDNTSVLQSWRKTHSKSLSLNLEMQRVQEAASEANITLQAEYVPTKHNLADGPSRGRPLGGAGTAKG